MRYNTKEAIGCLVVKILFAIDFMEVFLKTLFLSKVKRAIKFKEFWFDRDEQGHKVPPEYGHYAFNYFMVKCLFDQYGRKRIAAAGEE